MSDLAQSRASERRVYRVGDLLSGLRALLEDRVGRLWIVGEISNLHRAASGHYYFTLKDDRGQIRAALFRSDARRLPFEIEEGLEIVVYAEVTLYEARGDLQLVVRNIEPRGQGALQLAFEQLRRRLEAEGLFEADRKRPIPSFPRRVGVVSSPDGAAIRDVIQVSSRRSPSTPLLLAPTRVQGEGAEREIAWALRMIAEQSDVDVILLVRGGGSLEDLWAFNTEIVARAIASCPIPVVAGVGHEVDITIADLVADVRAPTPSAAAAQVLPDRLALASQLQRDWRRLTAAMRNQLVRARSSLSRRADALRVLAPGTRLATQRARLAAASRALVRALSGDQQRRGARLAAAAGRLDVLSPLAVLERGYAFVRRASDGSILRSADQVVPGDTISIRLGQGELEASVESVRSTPDSREER